MSNNLFFILLNATLQTLYMVGFSALLSAFFGIPLGILLSTSKQGGLIEHSLLYRTLSGIVNIIRSIPFIILVVAIIPLTRLLVGTSIGNNAAIVPLTLGAIPFIARITENALSEISSGLIEAGKTMGANPMQIIVRILLPEALPALINGITLTLITLVGYSAMAGAVGAGGLGYLAISYGYEQFNAQIMLLTVVILVGLVQLFQWGGDHLSAKFKHN